MQMMTLDGHPYETFEYASEIEVGHIVELPDGRAGEVTDVRDDGHYAMVRAWDENRSVMFDVDMLRPWIEAESPNVQKTVERYAPNAPRPLPVTVEDWARELEWLDDLPF